MNLPKFLAVFACAVAALAGSAAAGGSTVIILRHGEKPEKGLGQITCQGLNRALALAPLLLQRYGKPTAIYAPNPAQMKKDLGVPYAYIRPLATIEPLAVRAGMPVNLQWSMTEVPELGDELIAAPAGTYVVAWEHHWAENLARYLLSRLGGNPLDVPEWQGKDFDSLFVVRIRSGEGASPGVGFSHEHQGLDGLPQACPDAVPAARP